MTEKRFTMGYKVYRDNLTGERYDEVTESYKICDLLNELSEENEHLKQRNKRLEYKIQRERTSFTKTHERWSKEAETKIKELSEENEQLKKELKKTDDFIEEVWRKYEIAHGLSIDNSDWY